MNQLVDIAVSLKFKPMVTVFSVRTCILLPFAGISAVVAGVLDSMMKVIYVDTVGFIADIPTTLIASFSATLEDALNAVRMLSCRMAFAFTSCSYRHRV